MQDGFKLFRVKETYQIVSVCHACLSACEEASIMVVLGKAQYQNLRHCTDLTSHLRQAMQRATDSVVIPW